MLRVYIIGDKVIVSDKNMRELKVNGNIVNVSSGRGIAEINEIKKKKVSTLSGDEFFIEGRECKIEVVRDARDVMINLLILDDYRKVVGDIRYVDERDNESGDLIIGLPFGNKVSGNYFDFVVIFCDDNRQKFLDEWMVIE